MRSGGRYQKDKLLLQQHADLIDAYRLPPVFAHTDIATDLLLFQKK